MEGISVKTERPVVNLTEKQMFILSHTLTECCDNQDLIAELKLLLGVSEDEVLDAFDKLLEVFTSL